MEVAGVSVLLRLEVGDGLLELLVEFFEPA